MESFNLCPKIILHPRLLNLPLFLLPHLFLRLPLHTFYKPQTLISVLTLSPVPPINSLANSSLSFVAMLNLLQILILLLFSLTFLTLIELSNLYFIFIQQIFKIYHFLPFMSMTFLKTSFHSNLFLNLLQLNSSLLLLFTRISSIFNPLVYRLQLFVILPQISKQFQSQFSKKFLLDCKLQNIVFPKTL